MIHLVFVKMKDGPVSDALLRELEDDFAAIAEAMAGEVPEVSLLRNCVARDQNADLLIRVEMRDPEVLPRYLEHPLHLAVREKLLAQAKTLTSFDYEP